MEFSIVFKAIIFGIIEGLTEFIPVSSTAHLLIASKISNFNYIENSVFEVVIQLGAIMAVIVLYFQKILQITTGFFSNKESRSFVFNIFLAFIPSVIFGILFYDIIKAVFFSLNYISATLILGGILIIIIEKLNIKPNYNKIETLSRKTALKIGLFQVFSIIPGVSRSGATIMGSLLLKLDRKTATEFSFFLAIPTIFGAVCYDIYQNIQILNAQNIKIIFIGFIAAFLSSMFVIKWLINFVSNNNFIIFAYYRILIGFLILLYLILNA